MLNINGVNMDFRMTDADFYEKYMENAEKMDKVMSTAVDEKDLQKNYKKAAELMRAKCAAVKEFLDELFGEGTGDSVCGEGNDFGQCYEVYNAIIEEVQALGKAFNERVAKASGNRAQRRKAATK